jgi:anaerobic magnesium-protoporphyrin IX monomethyl ester cyclase
MSSTVILFNPMPVKHQAAVVNKRTTSLQVPLINVPLSLLALARMVKDDFNVIIINAVVDTDYTNMILEACRDAICLGVSSMTCYQIKDGLNVSAAVKERYPGLPVIWGGYHPTTQSNQTLKNPNIDIVVRGQGELTFKEAVNRLHTGQTLENVNGTAYKAGGRIITNPDREFTDLNVFPPIPYGLIDVERCIKEYKFAHRCIDYYISQGCASGCDFCSEPVFCGRHWTALDPSRVVDELEHLASAYNIDTFMIRDSDFFLNIRHVKELSRLLIKRNLGLRLTSVNGRMEQLARMDDEVWSLIRQAGIYEVFVGTESGYQAALDAMNKGAIVEHIDICTRQCVKHDIDMRASFMVGVPGIDTKREVKLTFEAIHGMISVYGREDRLDHMDILLSFFTPYPGTRLYDVAVKCGLQQLSTLEEWGDFDQFDFKAPWMPSELYDLVLEFRDGMPWNSGCGFQEWCEIYSGIMEKMKGMN